MNNRFLAGIVLTGALLAGCGDERAEQLNSVQQQLTELEQKHEQLTKDYAQLQADYEKVTAEQVVKEEQHSEEQDRKNHAAYLQEKFVAIAPKTVQGPYQVLVQDPEESMAYKVEQLMLATAPNDENNVYELAFQQLFPHLTFNEVLIHDNQTITIDFHENSIGSPNMTATGQVAPFFDMLEFFLYYNFPDLKAYYLYSNGEPTSIGESGVYTEAQPNDGLNFEHLYLDLH